MEASPSSGRAIGLSGTPFLSYAGKSLNTIRDKLYRRGGVFAFHYYLSRVNR